MACCASPALDAASTWARGTARWWVCSRRRRTPSPAWDPSPAMVAAGTARVKSLALANVRYCEAEGESLPLPDKTCDSVLFLQSLQYVREPAAALGEAARVLAPGGTLLITTLAAHGFNESERYGHRHRGFSPAQLHGWTSALGGHRLIELPPEVRPPRFQTVILTAEKVGAEKAGAEKAKRT